MRIDRRGSINEKILINGQWQGGADISALYGAKEIKDVYLRNINYDEAEISTDESDLSVENNIVGYRILKTQMKQVFQRLEADQLI